jgi:site-specific DNA recombinase
VPTMPPPATLRQVADHIDEIIGAGSHSQRKALIEALAAQIKITGPGRIVPVLRIPQPETETSDRGMTAAGVRALTNLVDLLRTEPDGGCCRWRTTRAFAGAVPPMGQPAQAGRPPG